MSAELQTFLNKRDLGIRDAKMSVKSCNCVVAVQCTTIKKLMEKRMRRNNEKTSRRLQSKRASPARHVRFWEKLAIEINSGHVVF